MPLYTAKCSALRGKAGGATIPATNSHPQNGEESAVGEPFPATPTSQSPPEERLDSWKAIAAYLKRDVTTVQRWEKREGMPVHRHLHDKRGSVYALGHELDAWLQSRRPGSSDQGEEPEAHTPGDGEADHEESGRTQRGLWVGLTGVGLLVVLAVAYYVVRIHANGVTRPKIQSLAVLPLKNLSGDASQEYLADGLTEALIGRLAGIHDLRVVSRTSVVRFKDPQVSVPEIAKILGVDAIVEGSVMREGTRIRVTAQLIRGATDEHFWSETYDQEFRDVLPLESELAQSIAKKVEVTVTGEEHKRLTATRPVAPEVYESYLKGMYALDRGNDQASIEQGMSYFEDAIKRDAAFAPAYVGLANGYDELGTVFIGSPVEQMRPKVVNAARRALELDPNIVEAHLLLAAVQQEEWHWAEAEAEYRRALELDPNDADAHSRLAFWLLCQGRTEEALTWARRGRDLDPMAVSGTTIGDILFYSRRYQEAIHEYRSALAVQPEDASALWGLGFALVANNQPEDAIPVLQKALSVSNRSPGVMGVLIRAYAHAGRHSDALRLLAELNERSKAGYVPAGAFVNAYLGLGENDQAFAWLERAYNEQSNILQFLKVHPFFDPIRADHRFAELVRRVGLA